ncbi:hypothetical protein SNEBB_006578 [Seison nebaliae]|nr:hypothetical protein SNEBB_006578 [Seison nebaliae]
MISAILLSFIVILCILHINQYVKRRNLLKSIKLSFPENTSLIFGNSQEIKKLNYDNFVKKYTKLLGNAWTYSSGIHNFVVLSDPDAIRKCFIERSTEFNARPEFVVQIPQEERHLFNSHGKRWKDLRKLLGRAFTAKKMRKLNDEMIMAIFNCIDVLDRKTNGNRQIDIFRCFKRMTLEAIETCGFGLKSEYQNSNDEKYFKDLDMITSRHYLLDVILSVSTLVGWIMNHFKFLLICFMKSIHVVQLTKDRLKMVYLEKSKLKLDEDAQKNLLTIIMSTDDDNENMLNEKSIVGNLFLFLIAGYETTSTALSYAAHAVVAYPEIQEKLRSELLEFANNQPNSTIDKKTFNFDNINQLEYLDAVTKEILRFRPIAPSVISRCNLVPTQLDVGEERIINIPENTVVVGNILSLHFNNQLWGPEDPLKFIPERHLDNEDRHSVAFSAFGIGPRECIGKRFALMEFKLTLAYLLSQYELLPGENFEQELNVQSGITNVPANGVFVKLRKL